MYENQINEAAAMVKGQPKHMEFAENVVKELLQFGAEEQNEVVKFLRKVSIEERQRKAASLQKEAEYLMKTCEGLN